MRWLQRTSVWNGFGNAQFPTAYRGTLAQYRTCYKKSSRAMGSYLSICQWPQQRCEESAKEYQLQESVHAFGHKGESNHKSEPWILQQCSTIIWTVLTTLPEVITNNSYIVWFNMWCPCKTHEEIHEDGST